MNLYENFDFNDDDFDEEEFDNYGEPLTIHNLKRYKEVICIKDCYNDNNQNPNNKKIYIYKGEIKSVKNWSNYRVWFKDTPGGYGSYRMENFLLLNTNESLDWDDEDFEFEEEQPYSVFKIKDEIYLNPYVQWWDSNKKVWRDSSKFETSPHKITDIKHTSEIKGDKENDKIDEIPYDGYMAQLSTKWPWYKIDNMKAI